MASSDIKSETRGGAKAAEAQTGEIYDRRTLTYANSFDDPWTAFAIKAIEWCTGKLTILRMVAKFERKNAIYRGQKFWRGALDTMGVELLTPPEQLANIPKTGPVVVVANHPHGMVDGMIMADLIGRVREDYRILTRTVLTGRPARCDSGSGIGVPDVFCSSVMRQATSMRSPERAWASPSEGLNCWSNVSWPTRPGTTTDGGGGCRGGTA